MSYRIHGTNHKGDSTQLFGNNVYPDQVLEVLQKQGCVIDDSCFDDFEIKNIQEIIDATEEYIMEEYEFHNNMGSASHNIFDLTLDEIQKKNMTYSLKQLQDNAYIFTSANIVRFFEDDIELDYDKEREKLIWKIKKGHKIYLEAY